MTHEYFMKEALKEAQKALPYGDIPIGTVIVQEGTIIARAHNQVERLKDPTAHSEMLAITQAADQMKHERLLKTVLYTTLEPCAMCAGAIVLSRIPVLCFATADPKAGACGSIFNIVRDDRLNHRASIITGILEQESRFLIQEFFKKLRKEKR